jgi:CDP-glucose 4,6-dehydratase
MRPDADFWKGKRVLLTGHTGFKGGWLALWLHRLGAHVTGVALPPNTEPNLFTIARLSEISETHFVDIRDAAALREIIHAARPEIVFHLAAQPLVRAAYRDPLDTFSSNVMGTAHVLDALRGLDGVRVAVMITTDKVYRDQPPPHAYREDDALGGHDPYSASKAACEIVISSYRDSYLAAPGVAVASARAGNVIGGGDWSADRLIPDAVRAWQSGATLAIRRPDAVRPWQHVLEPLAGYLMLAQKLWEGPELAGAYNFGPHAHEAASVRQVVELARAAYGAGETHFDETRPGPHEAHWLALDVELARDALGVAPRWTLRDAVARTMNWYRRLHEGADARELCERDIIDFESTQ